MPPKADPLPFLAAVTAAVTILVLIMVILSRDRRAGPGKDRSGIEPVKIPAAVTRDRRVEAAPRESDLFMPPGRMK